MKPVYPNDPCPCGSGRKYQNCCMRSNDAVIGRIGAIPIYGTETAAYFTVNTRGAVVFKDESKQPVLEIPEGSTKKYVLSVGLSGSRKPIATIQDQEGAVCYILPDWYKDWCETCMAMSVSGMKMFPSNVTFSKQGDRYFADFDL